MTDFANIDDHLLDAPRAVLEALSCASSRFDPSSSMLVGAHCRDILHSASGHEFALRGTSDLDLGIAIADWDDYDEIAASFPRTGSTGIRHTIAGIPVDIMPFGAVEHPTGTVTPSPRNAPMDVFAFTEVFAGSLPLALSGDLTCRIPSLEGYAALKLKAWADRSANWDDKDAADIALVLWWYSESAAVMDRLYGSQAGQQTLESLDFDTARASAFVLGSDIQSLLGSARASELRSAWLASDLHRLSDSMARSDLGGWPPSSGDRRLILAALTLGLGD